MKLSYKFFNRLLPLLALVATERFCYFQTSGFRLSKVFSSHVYPLSPCPPTDQAPIERLNQPFRFLGKGVQFYVFLGEDQKTILKLFKHHHAGLSTDLIEKLKIQALFKSVIEKRERRMKNLLTSAALARELLEKETATFYSHLTQTAGSLPTISLYGPLNIAYSLDLNKIQFVLQEKATPCESRLNALLKKKDLEKALILMESLIHLVHERSKKGIKNKDCSLLKNCGFLQDMPLEIDIGSYYKREKFPTGSPHKKAVLKAQKQLLCFIRKRYPEHLNSVEELFIHQTFND